MQRQMNFLEAPPLPGSAPVWIRLDHEDRIQIGAALARLIAKAATPPQLSKDEFEEKIDE